MRGTDLGCAFWARAPFLGLLAHTVSSLTAPLSCQLSGCSFAATVFRKLPLSHTWSSQAQLSSVSLTIPSSAPTRQPPPKPSWVPGLSASISLALSRPCSWLQVWTPNMTLAERSFTGDHSSSHWPIGGLKLWFHLACGVPTSLGLIHSQYIWHLAHQVILPTLPCQVKPYPSAFCLYTHTRASLVPNCTWV